MRFRVHSGRHARRNGGQTFLFIAVFAAMFLAGVIGISTDYSQLWARRQMAQAAADAACQAGAADLYLDYATGGSTAYSLDYSWVGAGGTTGFDCSSSSYGNSAPCKYASYNGYSGSAVSVTFPSSVTGAPDLSGFTVTHPYIRVAVTDTFALSFTRIFVGSSTASVTANAACGLVIVNAPIPLLIMHPTNSGAFNLNGGGSVTIIGGPTKSIQVNSSASDALQPASNTGSGFINLAAGGPSGTGSNFGVFGTESNPGYVTLGTTGTWVQPSLPYTDPWGNVAAPSKPATAGAVNFATFGTNGCPDPNGCIEFTAGDFTGCTSSGQVAAGGKGCLQVPPKYQLTLPTWSSSGTTYVVNQSEIQPGTGKNHGSCIFLVTACSGTCTPGNTEPNWESLTEVKTGGTWSCTTGGTVTDGSITWTNEGSGNNQPRTAIFDPGVYYVGAEGLVVAGGSGSSSSTVRQSTATGDGSAGTTFYFSTAGSGSNPGTVNVGAGAGGKSNCTTSNFPSCVVGYNPDGTSQTFGGITVASPAMKCPAGAALSSSVPTTGQAGNVLMGPCTGTYRGGKASDDAAGGTDRGFLFFQNRSLTSMTPTWGGGGGFLISGFLYFHATSDFSNTLTMSGNSASGALALGDIVTDNLTVSGTSGIKMILDPNVTSAVLRPQLLQ